MARVALKSVGRNLDAEDVVWDEDCGRIGTIAE